MKDATMRRLLLIVSIFMLIVTVTACGKNKENQPSLNETTAGEPSQPTSSQSTETQQAAEPNTEPSAETGTEPNAEPSVESSAETSTEPVDSDVSGLPAIEHFIQSIKNADKEMLQDMISPSGVVVIRSFSSGNGQRGQDVRNVYLSKDIPDNLQFPVDGEVPIDLHTLFVNSQQIEDLKTVAIETNNEDEFSFTDSPDGNSYEPSIQDTQDICTDLIGSSNDGEQYNPTIFKLGENEVVLTESTLAADFPVGVWAVFNRTDAGFKLRAIIDLR